MRKQIDPLTTYLCLVSIKRVPSRAIQKGQKPLVKVKKYMHCSACRLNALHGQTGRIQGGGVLGVRTPPLPFGGPPNFIKREKTLRVCTRKRRVLVLNSYPDPPFPKSCIRPWSGHEVSQCTYTLGGNSNIKMPSLKTDPF